ncbi:MAG: hypothetical protein KGL39_42200 [Patescibacteria group bacterium]|nr:hypothetical protein [Patescibacteria group bacterium]
MGLPNSKYNSGGVPHGGIFVDIYRPTDPENPNNGGAKLGTYRLESLTPKRGGKLTKRPDIDGGQNGWFIVDEDVEGNATIQRNVAATPTVENGDYFDAGVRIDATGNTVNERFVIHAPDRPIEMGYRKMAVSVIVDQYATGVAPRNPLNGT